MKNISIKSDLTLDFLIGNVKSVTTRTFEIENGEKILKDYRIKEYNSEGVRTISKFYKNDGSLKQMQIAEIEPNGFKIGYTNYDKNHSFDSQGKYDLDSRGNILNKYFNDHLEESYKYNEHGRIVEQYNVHSKDRLLFAYNNSEFATEQIYFMNGEKKYIIKYQNDSYGNIVKTETFSFPSMEKKHTQISIINDNGDEIEVYVELSDNEKVNWKKYTYDYDEKGNWISKISNHIQSNTKDITEREIIYHS